MGRPILDLTNGVNLSVAHRQAIGEIAVRWSELEDTIAELVWELANLRVPGAYAVTAHLSERTLVDMGKSLVDLLVTGPEPKLAAQIIEHLQFIINNLHPKRNAMIHSTWGHPGIENKSEILPIKARGKIKFGPREQYFSEDIFSIADEIYKANDKLYSFVSTIRELIPTWHHIAKS